MRNVILFLMALMLVSNNSWATVGWSKNIPATSENPQAISPDVIENNTALDLMLQNYRDGYLTVTLTSTSAITIGAGGVMLSNSGGSTRLMVANTSTTTMSSTNIDTGSISPSSTYYIYAYASSTTATTFSVIYSASSVSPAGITYYAQLGKFITDGSSNFISASSNINAQVGLGSWVAKTSGVVYQAATDGFIVGSVLENGSGKVAYLFYSDTSSSPTTERTSGQSGGTTSSSVIYPFFCPIRKGDYYQLIINYGSARDYFFISLGT
jgi:hypothetical protein